MSEDPPPDPKTTFLRAWGLLHPHAEKVRDELFHSRPFFDPRDLLQVRYEMLRRHRVDGLSIPKVVERFGVSRPTFYHVEAAYHARGLPGLVPQKRGPKGPRRCTPEIVAYARSRRQEDPLLSWETLLQEIVQQFGGEPLHRRTVERGLAREAKKGRRRTARRKRQRSRPPSSRSTKRSGKSR
jgi:transposase